MVIDSDIDDTLCIGKSRAVCKKNVAVTRKTLIGWGAHCNGENTHGFWSQEEKRLHINQLEIIAAFLALKCFAREVQNCEILLRIDNTTAISYINRMGGVQYVELNQGLNIFGLDAVRESRRVNVDTEWELGAPFFQTIVDRWGFPEIDLFASGSSAKTEVFCSWKRDPEARYIDAFTVNWNKAQGIVVVPHWPTQPWFPLFKSMLLGEPLYFSPSPKLRLSPCREALRRSYQQKLVPAEAVEILISSLTDSTLKQYNTALKNWWSYSQRVFKNRPPKPKYDTTWNTKAVQNWAEALGPLKVLDLKSLTFKLVSLLALATAHRVQTLSLIKISDRTVSKSKSGRGACVATVLLKYVKRTKVLGGNEDYLFITFKRPYHRATAQSISRWIRYCLVEAGIHPRYTAHSTRHAATSAAEARGLDVNIKKSTAGWSASSQVFAKFYKRPIEPRKESFVEVLFNQQAYAWEVKIWLVIQGFLYDCFTVTRLMWSDYVLKSIFEDVPIIDNRWV
ncbi:uncharacterized protein LOC135142153 [Zophobas morio]|uniref:uncharacterized protein LOC135142153 n=1 Tax=Zophobas morio TaxID=2755281 RepID=UPI003083825F